MITRLALAVLLAAAMPADSLAAIANVPVPALDLARYSGQWHEVARLPMFFQRKCTNRTTATYTPLAEGRIEVRNACRTKSGATISVVGEARTVAGKPGALQVRFAPSWLAWLPMVWADYWVVDLDPDYRWAVVGGPDRDYLWILSRTPTMERSQYEQIKARAARRGYPVQDLVVGATLE